MTSCFFCALPPEKIIEETASFYIFPDAFPVTPGHTLVISKRHAPDFFSLTPQEQAEMNAAILQQRSRLMAHDISITGFNIGMNCGPSAGQTVMHFHAHIIPRRHGDMIDPRGGVRGVIPEKQKY